MIYYIKGNTKKELPLETPVHYCGFPKGFNNVLFHAGILTLDDLLQCGHERLKEICMDDPGRIQIVQSFLNDLWFFPPGERYLPGTSEGTALLENEHIAHQKGMTDPSQCLGATDQKGRYLSQNKEGLSSLRVLDYARQISEPLLRNLVIQRLHGTTLTKLSQEYEISPERVRQLTLGWLQHKNRMFYEDRYISIFQKYDFSKEDFLSAFFEPVETYYYLSILCHKRNRRPLSEAADDPMFPETLRYGLIQLQRRDQICVNGTYISKHRMAIMEYLARTYFREDGNFSDLLQKYQEFLISQGLAEEYTLKIKTDRFVDHLSNAEFLLRKPGSRFRYYDIQSRDFTGFLAELNLEQYQNAEYSAQKIFSNHSELMQAYDIRDGYELHNLLRKLCSKHQIAGIRFSRNPILEFGSPSRYKQMYGVLLSHSPITPKDAVLAYEEKYGIRPEDWSYFAPFKKFLHNGFYDLTIPPKSPQL